MIAARLSSVWQVAGVAGAALCCYLVSQSVASERAALDRLDRQIAHAQDDIRRLNTEIGTRSRMAQIERWNASVLALQAPRPGQFVRDGVQLASLYGRAGRNPLPLDQDVMATKGAVDVVAYHPAAPAAAPATPPAAAAPQPAAAVPLLRAATFVRPKPTALAPDVPAITHAALSVKPAAPLPSADLPTAEKPVEKVAKKPQAVAPKLEAAAPVKAAKALAKTTKPAKVDLASLLPSDLGTLAAAESKGRKAKPVRDAR